MRPAGREHRPGDRPWTCRRRAGTQPGIRTQYLSFLFKPPFDNPLVRQAVYHAIDRAALRDTVWGDLAQPAIGPVPGHMGGFEPAFPLSDFDPTRARALLQQAGQALPVGVEATCRRRSW